jgi:hypothetical protein
MLLTASELQNKLLASDLKPKIETSTYRAAYPKYMSQELLINAVKTPNIEAFQLNAQKEEEEETGRVVSKFKIGYVDIAKEPRTSRFEWPK